MNPVRLLVLPWMALSRPWRIGLGGWTAIVVVLAALGSAFTYAPSAAWGRGAAHGAAILDCLLWAGVLSQPLLLAREAYRLRLPALGRDVRASLALYALLTIALPSLLLAAFGGEGAVALVEIALGAGLGLAYATLPPYLGLWVCFVPMLTDHGLARWLPMPARSTDGFLAWAMPCTAALWLLLGWNWRRAVRRDYGLEGSRKPILLTLRTLAWYGRGAGNDLETQQLRRGVRWLQRTADLRGCGPGHAFTTLRVALGGWYMPQTPGSRLRQLGLVLAGLASIALIVVLPMLSDPGAKDVHSLLTGTGILMIYSGMIGPLLAVVHAQTLQRRWHRTNAELPLLALLPRLGPAHAAQRALLRASVLPGLVAQLLCLLAMLGVAVWLHLGAFGDALLLFGQLASMGMLLVLTLVALGGAAPRQGWLAVLVAGGVLLIMSNSAWLLPLFDGHPLIDYPAAAWIFAVLWAAFLAPLFRLGWRGWRGFHRRPHPFLPTT